MQEGALPIWEEPVRGGYIDRRLMALPRDEGEAAWHDGRRPSPPIHHLYGLRYESSDADGALFTLPVTRWLLPHPPPP
jgi:hypothetical protein